VSNATTWIDFVGPQAVFQIFRFDPVEQTHKPLFKMFLVSEKLEPVGKLVPDCTFKNAPHAEIVVIPAQQGSAALHEWLRKVVVNVDVMMSVCTGASHLARAGFLDGQQATTHHESIDEFTERYPTVKWVRGMRFVEGEIVSTGGGLTAGIDLALRVAERYFGRDWALHVAEALEYEGHGWMVSPLSRTGADKNAG